MPEKSEESVSAPSETSEVSNVSVTKARKPRVMSETQLAQLALAREKAVIKRRELGDVKRREKAVKDDLLTKRIAKLKLVEECDYSESSESSEASESSAEPEPKPKPKAVRKKYVAPPPPPPRPRADPQDYSTPQLTAEMARHELQQRVQRETYQSAFQSMFPGHVLQF